MHVYRFLLKNSPDAHLCIQKTLEPIQKATKSSWKMFRKPCHNNGWLISHVSVSIERKGRTRADLKRFVSPLAWIRKNKCWDQLVISAREV